MKTTHKIMSCLLASAMGVSQAAACTGISLSTTNNEYVQARTIEWGESDLKSKLVVVPRQHTFTSDLPMNTKGKTWTSKYGFVGISVSEDRFIGEGMNEVGLNAGLFYFKGYGLLAPFDPKNTADNVADMDFIRWMLGQFETVEEVKAALPSITLAPIFIEDGKPSPTAHWRVADKTGANIVIEIVENGKVNIYDNDVGVLTNSPDFPWMKTNLNNYINIFPGTLGKRNFDGVELRSLGAGTGALGLPGDITPPSRFVRAAFYRSTVPPLKDATSAVSQAFHILDNFDLPIGIEFTQEQQSHIPDIPSATQWTAASDLNNGFFYYKSMSDSAIKRVDLNTMDFTMKGEVIRPINNGQFNFQEVSF